MFQTTHKLRVTFFKNNILNVNKKELKCIDIPLKSIKTK